MMVVFIIFLPVLAMAGTVDLPKTGQTTSYYPGDDGDIKVGISWPEPRFTDNGDGTVTDNLTGLMWLKDANCINTEYPVFDNDGTPGDGRVTWQHALDFVAGINVGTYPNCGAGYTDWRLPNVNELESLATNAEETNIATWLNQQGFINVQKYNWSSTTLASAPDVAWVANMWIGRKTFFSKSYYGINVWPVRAATTPPAQLWKTGQTTCYDESGFVIDCTDTGQDGEINRQWRWNGDR